MYIQKFYLKKLILCYLSSLILSAYSNEDQLREAVANLHSDFAYRLESSFDEAKDIEVPLQVWLDLRSKNYEQQATEYLKILNTLNNKTFKALPAPTFKEVPKQIPLNILEEIPVDLPYAPSWSTFDNKVICHSLSYELNGLNLYGLSVTHKDKKQRPLLVYVHGAAYGIPVHFIHWLKRLAAEEGYDIIAPSFRGEPQFTSDIKGVKNYNSEGDIENLLGEPEDIISLVNAWAGHQKIDIDSLDYGIVGHSFGAGAGLLACARDTRAKVMVSYDAWMTNPFRFYWERLQASRSTRNKSYLWGSWDEFLEQPASEQLSGLMKRSVTHQAVNMNAKLLLFMGGGYNGSAYHYSHEQFVGKLREHKKEVEYFIIPLAGHNFVLYVDSPEAKDAYKIQSNFLQKHYPGKP